jgi:hypothetical protein
MTEGRYEEALKILKDGAKTNKRTLPPDSEVLEMLKTLHDEVHLLSAVARALLFTLAAVECALKKMSAVYKQTKGKLHNWFVFNIHLPFRTRKRILQRLQRRLQRQMLITSSGNSLS